MNYNSSLEDFEKALYRLDELLVENNSEPIEVKALGGFAMMYYEVRENGYTVDIDSLTEDYDDSVIELIKNVGEQLELDADWLNTDCAKLDGYLDVLVNQIEWVPSKYSFEKIIVLIANEIGLLRSKARAVHDGGLVPRITDKKDLIALLKLQNVSCISELDMKNDLSFIKNEYKRCYEYLASMKKW